MTQRMNPRMIYVQDAAEALMGHLKGQEYRTGETLMKYSAIMTDLSDLLAWIRRGQYTLLQNR